MFAMVTNNVCVNMFQVILTYKCYELPSYYPFFRFHYDVTVTRYITRKSLYFQSIIHSHYYLCLKFTLMQQALSMPLKTETK